MENKEIIKYLKISCFMHKVDPETMKLLLEQMESFLERQLSEDVEMSVLRFMTKMDGIKGALAAMKKD